MFVQAWSNFYQLAMMTAILFTLWWPTRKSTTPFSWKWSIILISVFLTLADYAYFCSLSSSLSMVSIVSMIRRSSVIVSFLCGALLFHEKNLKSKAIDLVLVLLGLVFLLIGSLQ
jgi:transporter family protein